MVLNPGTKGNSAANQRRVTASSQMNLSPTGMIDLTDTFEPVSVVRKWRAGTQVRVVRTACEESSGHATSNYESGENDNV